MIFVDPSGYDQAIPPALVVSNAPGFFILQLNTAWTFPVFAQWDIEYSMSTDGVSYGPWLYGHTVNAETQSYNFMLDIDVTIYYQFRYRCKSRTEISDYSQTFIAGQPLPARGSARLASMTSQSGPITNIFPQTFTSYGGMLILYSYITGYRASNGPVTWGVTIDGASPWSGPAYANFYFNQSNVHAVLTPHIAYTRTVAAGSHSLAMVTDGSLSINSDDSWGALLFEFPTTS